ncbi:MAG: Short-chain dehydrogenase/reductase [Klenkia sp.]|nr:Short-chain dehydrogenase/reductase [Klenkia sp.]
MGRLEGKVAFITGAARGQGRAHAVAMAREGAEIIAVDIAQDAPELGLGYRLGSAEELAETAAEVESLDRRVVTAQVDVRDGAALAAAVADGVAQLGRLDIVVANAGIAANSVPLHLISDDDWDNMIAINLSGVWRTCKAVVPHLIEGGRGGSIILTSSLSSMKTYPGLGAYTAAKHGVVGLARVLANELGQHRIRVNSLHPTQVRTAMLMNDATYKLFRPDLENPTEDDFAAVSAGMHVLPEPYAEPQDIAAAAVFLASDDARLITGIALPVDAGNLVK